MGVYLLLTILVAHTESTRDIRVSVSPGYMGRW